MINFETFCERALVLSVNEQIFISQISSVLDAKVDTGNEAYNVIHGKLIDHSKSIFELAGKKVKLPIQKWIDIHVGSGNLEKRPVVLLDITLKGQNYKKIPFSVADRGMNEEPVLLGAQFLKKIKAVVYLREGFVRNALAAGALGMAAVTGLNTDAVSQNNNLPKTVQTEPSKAQSSLAVKGSSLSPQQFINIWMKAYETTSGQASIKLKLEGLDRLNRFIANGQNPPPDVVEAIRWAVYVFQGDYGIDPKILQQVILWTGATESEYIHRRALKGGRARSYWQIVPGTALSILEHSRALLGPKFQTRYNVDSLRDMSEQQLMDLIEKDNFLAAAFCAVTWLVNKHGREELKQHHAQ